MCIKTEDERLKMTARECRMAAWVIRVPAAQMALFKAIVESYDNLATLRTEDPAEEQLKLYFSPQTQGDVEALLNSLAPVIPISYISRNY